MVLERAVAVEQLLDRGTATKGETMHDTTAHILTDVTNHMNNLAAEHQKLHTEIEHNQYWAPDSELAGLKKKKLRLKDEIQYIKDNLITLSKQ